MGLGVKSGELAFLRVPVVLTLLVQRPHWRPILEDSFMLMKDTVDTVHHEDFYPISLMYQRTYLNIQSKFRNGRIYHNSFIFAKASGQTGYIRFE